MDREQALIEGFGLLMDEAKRRAARAALRALNGNDEKARLRDVWEMNDALRVVEMLDRVRRDDSTFRVLGL